MWPAWIFTKHEWSKTTQHTGEASADSKQAFLFKRSVTEAKLQTTKLNQVILVFKMKLNKFYVILTLHDVRRGILHNSFTFIFGGGMISMQYELICIKIKHLMFLTNFITGYILLVYLVLSIFILCCKWSPVVWLSYQKIMHELLNIFWLEKR